MVWWLEPWRFNFCHFPTQVVEQWGLYDGYDPKLEKVLRRRRTGRHMPIMNVIPPGLDFSNLKVRLSLLYRHRCAWPAL